MQFLVYRASDDDHYFVKTFSTIKELVDYKEKIGYDLIITDNVFYKEKDAPNNWDKILYNIIISDD